MDTVLTPNTTHHPWSDVHFDTAAFPWLVPLGRALFSLIFLFAGPEHFKEANIHYAQAQGVPMAALLVPAAGLLAMLGGLLIAFGFFARVGALMLIAFLVPVTLTMHAFWSISDPMMAQLQMAMFMKNVAMLGGALCLLYFGSGPLSVDSYRRQHGHE